MDYSKYIENKMKAANTYKSNWQARDASEVTLRRSAMSSKNNSTVHQGPIPTCCTGSLSPSAPQEPGNGFNTTYSMEIVSQAAAGAVNCCDPIWGTSGGVSLLTCNEVQTILKVPSNPIKGTNCTIPSTSSIITYTPRCADTCVVQRGVVSTLSSAYTGWRNQVPASINGSKPTQTVPFPSN
jgi:hypothetical protein